MLKILSEAKFLYRHVGQSKGITGSGKNLRIFRKNGLKAISATHCEPSLAGLQFFGENVSNI